MRVKARCRFKKSKTSTLSRPLCIYVSKSQKNSNEEGLMLFSCYRELERRARRQHLGFRGSMNLGRWTCRIPSSFLIYLDQEARVSFWSSDATLKEVIKSHEPQIDSI